MQHPLCHHLQLPCRRQHLQGSTSLQQGPTQRGPSCLTPLLPLLRLRCPSDAALPRYAAAWLLVRRLVEVRADGDALLARLLLDGTLQAALRSSVWDTSSSAVRGSW